MSDRLNEALEWWDSFGPGFGDVFPDPKHIPTMVDAARAYADLRVEPDYEAAFQVMSGDVADQLTEDEIREGRELVAEAVRAAIGDRLLIDPPKEEE